MRPQYGALLFRNVDLTPEQQYALTKVRALSAHSRLPGDHHIPQAFDPTSESYGHGNKKTEGEKKSILHPDLKTIPHVPQVQLTMTVRKVLAHAQHNIVPITSRKIVWRVPVVSRALNFT